MKRNQKRKPEKASVVNQKEKPEKDAERKEKRFLISKLKLFKHIASYI